MPTSSRRRPIAAIDVGTNTTLLLIARPSVAAAGAGPEVEPEGDPEILADEAEVTRLGRGIGEGGRLGRPGIERTLATLRRYAAIAHEHDATIVAIGTEALRRAPNADEFLDPAGTVLGSPVEVITGEHEAALTFRAVAESFPAEIAAGRVAVVDIGGGSTEIIVSERGKVRFDRSLRLGSVLLHERHVRHDPPTAAEAQAIERDITAALEGVAEALEGGPFVSLIGVAGTVTSLAAMTLGLASYDSSRVHGLNLASEDIAAQITRLASASQVQRERIAGLDPRRADVIFAGAILLRAIAAWAGVPSVRVSDRGIRWGLYYERVSLQPKGDGDRE